MRNYKNTALYEHYVCIVKGIAIVDLSNIVIRQIVDRLIIVSYYILTN